MTTTNEQRQGEAKSRLLVIDDEPDTLDILRPFLSMFGFEVFTALTGKQGKQAIVMHNPDVVVLDLMLPDMDGLELCRQVRQNPATVRLPVIILSARTGKEEVRQGYEAGATLYLKKPVDMDQLVAECKRVIALGKHVTRPLDAQVADANAPATGMTAPSKIGKGTTKDSDSPPSTS